MCNRVLLLGFLFLNSGDMVLLSSSKQQHVFREETQNRMQDLRGNDVKQDDFEFIEQLGILNNFYESEKRQTISAYRRLSPEENLESNTMIEAVEETTKDGDINDLVDEDTDGDDMPVNPFSDYFQFSKQPPMTIWSPPDSNDEQNQLHQILDPFSTCMNQMTQEIMRQLIEKGNTTYYSHRSPWNYLSLINQGAMKSIHKDASTCPNHDRSKRKSYSTQVTIWKGPYQLLPKPEPHQFLLSMNVPMNINVHAGRLQCPNELWIRSHNTCTDDDADEEEEEGEEEVEEVQSKSEMNSEINIDSEAQFSPRMSPATQLETLL